jgi:hypothetical protein
MAFETVAVSEPEQLPGHVNAGNPIVATMGCSTVIVTVSMSKSPQLFVTVR